MLLSDVTSEIRLLLGQTLLADDKTIQELRIKEGDALHMVLEPAKDITFSIKIPMMGEKQFSFSNNSRISHVLQHLLDSKLISGQLKEQILMLQDKQLDMDMPLHVYDIEKHGGLLRVLPLLIGVCVVDEYNDEMYVTVNTKLHKILDVKNKIAANCKMPNSNMFAAYKEVMQSSGQAGTNQANQMYGQPNQQAMFGLSMINLSIFSKVYENPEHMRLYVQQGESYKLLQDDCLIKDSGLEQNSKLHLIYYGWGPGQYAGAVQTYKYARFTKGRIDPQSLCVRQPEGEITFVGKATAGHTLLSAALKMQEQLDIPVENIQIYRQYSGNTKCQLLQQITAQDYQHGFIVEY